MKSMTVIYRIALATFMGVALTVAIASHSVAQQQQLIGTWLLVSEITEFPDGKRLEGFGGNQKGMLIFDRTGRYSSQLTGASRIKFASNRLQGTPEENKGVSAGSLAHFGTYSIDAAGTTLTYHVERSSFPNWDGTDQKWSIIKFAGDDLTLGVARTSSGGFFSQWTSGRRSAPRLPQALQTTRSSMLERRTSSGHWSTLTAVEWLH